MTQSGRFLVILISLVVLALGVLALLAKVYLDDTRRRTEEAEVQRQASEVTNRENQDAILRLMNELGDLADGDLTIDRHGDRGHYRRHCRLDQLHD